MSVVNSDSVFEPSAEVTRVGKCSCGQLSVTILGQPVRIAMCHCFECQKRTGSAFGVQARFKTEQIVAMEGEHKSYIRIGDSGAAITFKFCPNCASTICWNIEGMDGFTIIAVGCLNDPSIGTPVLSVYNARKHDWVETPSCAENWD